MENSAQIYVPQVKGEQWPPYDVEVLWGIPTTGGCYQIASPVVYSEGVHYGDIVSASFDSNGLLIFEDVVEHSHSETFLLVLTMSDFQRETLMHELIDLGTTPTFAATTQLVSVVVPADVDEDHLLDLLEQYPADELFFAPKDLMREMHRNIQE